MSVSLSFDTHFKNLLASWNSHQSLRQSGAPIADLARSRAHLDAARFAARRAA